MPVELKRGTRFLHKRVLNEKYEPQLYEITRITRHAVYYKVCDNGVLVGHSEYCYTDNLNRYIGEIQNEFS